MKAAGGSCRLIVNVDDLGARPGVLDAAIALHSHGIVSSTSLMITQPYAQPAIEAVKEIPGLAVGLHLALVDARALRPHLFPAGFLRRGRLPASPLSAGAAYSLRPSCRRAMEGEVEAQFSAFMGTGLTLSHVDSHMHTFLIPSLFNAAMKQCRRWRPAGCRAGRDGFFYHLLRAPARLERLAPEALLFCLLSPWMRRRAAAQGMVAPARCWGFYRSGKLTANYLAWLISDLPDGLHELHCHPDLGTPAGRAEYAALSSDEFRAALKGRGVRLTTYAEAAAEIRSRPATR